MSEKEVIKIMEPLNKAKIENLRAGNTVYISGKIYCARDAAHKRIDSEIKKAEDMGEDIYSVLPFGRPLDEVFIYYMGPSPAREGRVIGSAGPTTSGRMDKYTPKLLDMGLCAMIGKGVRTKEVYDAIIRNKAVYMAAVGGAGALLSKCIKKSKIYAYEDLGPEAVRELEVEDFPAIVVADSYGGCLYNDILTH